MPEVGQQKLPNGKAEQNRVKTEQLGSCKKEQYPKERREKGAEASEVTTTGAFPKSMANINPAADPALRDRQAERMPKKPHLGRISVGLSMCLPDWAQGHQLVTPSPGVAVCV